MQGCQGQMRTASRKLKSLQEKCESTLNELNRRYRRTSQKRMAKDDQEKNARKSLFYQDRNPLGERNHSAQNTIQTVPVMHDRTPSIKKELETADSDKCQKVEITPKRPERNSVAL